MRVYQLAEELAVTPEALIQKAKELTERFRGEFGGVTCRELQQQFTGRTYDMWNAEEYKAFDDARGKQCAHATGTVTKWVIEML